MTGAQPELPRTAQKPRGPAFVYFASFLAGFIIGLVICLYLRSIAT